MTSRSIPGVTIEAGGEAVWVRSEAPLRVVSSAFVGGELAATRHVVNMHWPHGWCDGLDEHLHAYARRLGIAEPFVGLMTTAATEVVPVTEAASGITVAAVVTVTLGGLVSAGRTPPAPWRPATINTIVLVDGRLGPAAAVNAVITATEAKAGALADAGALTPEGTRATGTLTDAVVVAWTDRGPLLDYLGPAALGGWLVARAVRRAVAAGIVPR